MTWRGGRLVAMELALFDEVGELLRGLLPPELGEIRQRSHRYGIKVWFGPAKPSREHYEAQVISARHAEGADVFALEVGFHAEHPDPAENERALGHLVTNAGRWKRALGRHATAGEFLGDRDDWRRLSETWADPDLSDPDVPIELATRLTDYITLLEPIRRSRQA